jgi:hypothetical protein
MPFTRANFELLNEGYTNAPRVFAYNAPVGDDQAAINTSGYFNAVFDVVAVGDHIVSNVAGQRVVFVVATRANGVVDVTNGVADATTNSD